MCCEIRDKEGVDYTNRGGIGIPQGGAISPMLMNLYLTPLDNACTSARYLRYADDLIMVRSKEERFVDITNEATKLGLKLVAAEKGPYEVCNHLGALVHCTSQGEIRTSLDYKKLKTKWTARNEARRSKMLAMDDQSLLRYINQMMVGVALYYGSISLNRAETLKFIRYFDTRLAWNHLLTRYESEEIQSNEKLCGRHGLLLSTYKELCDRVARLCVSIQLKSQKCMVKMRSLSGFMEAAKKHAHSKLLGLLTMSKEKVYSLYMLYCSRAL